MKVLSIGSDRKLFDKDARSRARVISHGKLAEELHVVVFTKSGDNFKSEQIAENVFIYPTNSWNRWFYVFDAYRLGKKIAKRVGCNLVTCQDPFESGLVGSRIASSLNLALHVQVHTDMNSPYFAAESSLNRKRLMIASDVLPKADGIRVVSKRIKESLIKNYPLKVEPSILPIHEEFSIDYFAERRDLLRSKYPQFARVVVMISRLETEKNVFMAINAFKNIEKSVPGAGLVIVGDGSIKPTLVEAVRRLEVEDKIIFDGWHENVIPYFLSANLFINPSNYEGYGRTLIEAAVTNCPIVTTNVGLIGDILTEREVLVSEPEDLDGFEKNLFYALSHPEEMRDRASLARERVMPLITLSSEQYLELYRKTWEDCLEFKSQNK